MEGGGDVGSDEQGWTGANFRLRVSGLHWVGGSTQPIQTTQEQADNLLVDINAAFS